MRLQIFCTLVLVLIGRTASAEATKCILSLGERTVNVHATFDPSEVSAEQVHELELVISEINTTLANQISKPDSIHLDISRAGNEFKTYPSQKRIKVAYYFGTQDARGAMTAKAFLAHEYGHLLLDEGLGPTSTWGQVYLTFDVEKSRIENLIQANDLESAKIRQQASEFSNRQMTFEADRAWRSYGEIIQQGIALNDELVKNYQAQANWLYRVRGPFDEFFGDIIAVAYSGDPRVITNGLQLGVPRADLATVPDAIYRDFSFSQIGPWHADSMLEARAYGPDLGRAQYMQLSQSRAFVWQNYLSKMSQDPTRRGGVIAGILKATLSELDAIVQKVQQRLPALSVDEMNSFLNKRIGDSLLF